MKKILIIVLGALGLISCTEVVFDEPQPVGAKVMQQIPSELQGKFSMVVLNEENILEIASDHIINDDGRAYLSDSLVVKKLDSRYVFNVKITDDREEKEGKWQSYVLEPKGCGFVKATSFIINSDSYIEPFVEAYGGTKFGEGQEKTIIAKPSADQFKAILEDDSVTLSIILERLK